jgi:hypothetical protein
MLANFVLHDFAERAENLKNVKIRVEKAGVDVMITFFCGFCQFSTKYLAFF